MPTMIRKRIFPTVLQFGLALAATFPLPSGSFNTSLTIHQLTDHTRLDPYSPTPQPRSVVISIFHPQTCIAIPTPYMDPLTAAWTDSQFSQFGIPPGTFSSLEFLTCPPDSTSKSKAHHPHDLEVRKATKKGEYPLILFSPGLGNPRLFYSAIAQQVASRGYTVVTIDHPYDAGIVVFPDNSTVLAANITTDAQILHALNVRVKDVSFVLDQLSRPSIAHSLIPGLSCGLDSSKAAIFGHSLGGATAASSMLADARLAAGINLDGSFFGPLSTPTSSSSISNPFLIFAHAGKNLTTDTSWAAIWPKLTGFKRLLELQGSAHGTFEDLGEIVDVLGLKGLLPPEVGELLGSIDGERAIGVMGTYVSAFFDFVLKGRKKGLLEGESKSWPEVVFLEVGE